MRNLGDQFNDIIQERLKGLNKNVADDIATLIMDDMLENTEAGRAFGNDPYDNEYSERSVRERRAQGLQTETVELRRGNNRIETVNSRATNKGATISFTQGGRIFKTHHDGLYSGQNRMPVRSIFPKTPESVPDDIHENAYELVREWLRGK